MKKIISFLVGVVSACVLVLAPFALADVPSAPTGGGTPSGSAGGDLTGSYPNPTVNTISSMSTNGWIHTTNLGVLVAANPSTSYTVYKVGNNAAGTVIGSRLTGAFSVAVVTGGSTITTDIVGVGAGNYVVKLCTDGATCAGGNSMLTCTQACTAAAGTSTACTGGNTAAASSTLTWSITTACATTNPAVNLNATLNIN